MTSSRIATPSRPALLLKERAYGDLKARIIRGRHPPGSFLSERTLAADLAMSKTPIRAALERLEAEGFVAVSPRQGIVVREPSLQEVADQFELRLALERHVIRALAGRLDRAQEKRLRQNLRAQVAAGRKRDLWRAVELDTEFHLIFCEFHGNQEIQRTLGRLREKITWVIWLVTRRDPGRVSFSVEEHQGLADAVIAGDAALAVERLEAHLEYGQQSLLARRSHA